MKTTTLIMLVALLSCLTEAANPKDTQIVVSKLGEATTEQCRKGIYTAPGLSEKAIALIKKYGGTVKPSELKPHEVPLPKDAFCIPNQQKK